jgi:hypothetical protein
MKQLEPSQLRLLQEVVSNRCPQLLNRVDAMNVTELTKEDRQIIVAALGNEFASSGLSENSEINSRGFEIEGLIDFINFPNLK